jgi:hypothetical protein
MGRVTVSGSSSGAHPGRLARYSGGRGVSFLPAKPFVAGESVRVRVAAAHGIGARSFSFRIARPAPIQLPTTFEKQPPPAPPAYQGPVVQSFRSQPALHPPTVNILKRGGGVAAGDIFAGVFAIPAPGGPPPASQKGPMVFDSSGQLVWFSPVPGREAALNVGVQRYNGAPVITYWQGGVLPLGLGFGRDIVLDSSYRQIATVGGANGYAADLHDFQLTPQGTAWIVAYSPILADLRSVGGASSASMVDSIVQEIDLRTGLVMFEWHALGHVPMRSTYTAPVRNVTYDPVHVNSIDVHGSTVLISARNTWAAYMVDTRTGRTLWTLGGQRSTFRPAAGARFAYQHDARLLAPNLVSVFDDQASPAVRPPSRGLVLRINPRRRTATVVQQYRRGYPTLSGSQGNMQTLTGGNRLVGWGSQSFVTEFNRGGKVVFEAQFPAPVESYRAFRFRWTGRPGGSPSLAITGAPGSPTAYASWNGATLVASWQLLAGPDAGHLTPLGAAAVRRGFETAIPLPFSPEAAGPFYAIQARDAAGRVLGTSAPVTAVGAPAGR